MLGRVRRRSASDQVIQAMVHIGATGQLSLMDFDIIPVVGRGTAMKRMLAYT